MSWLPWALAAVNMTPFPPVAFAVVRKGERFKKNHPVIAFAAERRPCEAGA